MRSFDREWIVPDKRVVNRPNPGLWHVRDAHGQVYLTAPHDRTPTGGPAATFTALIPDAHHYHGRGGRAYALWLDKAGTRPNVVPGILEYLAARYGSPVDVQDVYSYLAAIVAQPGYVSRFGDDLRTPGLRVPLTADRDLFTEAAEIGRRVIWLHTFGERLADDKAGRPGGAPRVPGARRPRVIATIPDSEAEMPANIEYDSTGSTLIVGAGRITPVEPAVWGYEVSGLRVVKHWLERRKREPEGRRSSPLDDIVSTFWEADWTTELLDLLNVLTLLVDLEPAQDLLLDRIISRPLVSVSDLIAAGVLPVITRGETEKPPRAHAQLFPDV
jgi:hypothetical protein